MEEQALNVSLDVKKDGDLVTIRKEKIVNYMKKNYNWIIYVLLAVVVFIAVKIRTINVPGLKDVTTGTWTLGPDLDPFLFLRWSDYIVEHGKLMMIDTMRYVPLGYQTRGELLLHPYMMAWFHKSLNLFGLTDSVTYSAILYPVFFFALTVIAFFFLVRKIFLASQGIKKANIIALISSLFLAIFEPLIPRTIAGIPEKESVGFFFMFLAFYLFLSAWQAKTKPKSYLLAILAGISTAGMALVWGGYTFIFLAIGPTVFIAFMFGKVEKRELSIYVLWMLSAFALMYPFSSRYNVKELFTSIDTGFSIAVLFIILLHFYVTNTKVKEKFKIEKLNNFQLKLVSFVASLALIIIITSILFGPGFIFSKITFAFNNLISPSQNRLLLTVAENRQPYFTEWAASFGPYLSKIPLTFWLFFIGSIFLFYSAASPLKKKERVILTGTYLFFIISIIFSRYAQDSVLNGVNSQSIGLYIVGSLCLVASLAFYLYKYNKNGEGERFKQIDFSLLFLFTLFFLSIVAARGSVRTIMVLVPSASAIIGYFVLASYDKAREKKDGKKKIALMLLAIIVISAAVFSAYSIYRSASLTAQSYVPNVYTQQWQKSMSFVRENTPQDAVFGHWWDYGYWLQSIGERATVLDGGNAVSYWNHLIGRHALTGTSNVGALEFLYAHNTTHFLIDSTDVGKYSAFSSIGSNVNYDRASFIPTLLKNNQPFQEKKNSTIFLYEGTVGLDTDIVYELNGTRVFLPASGTALAGIAIELDSNGVIVNNPLGIFIYQGKQYGLPLRYLYYDKFIDLGSGIESGVFLYPTLAQTQSGSYIDNIGALLYMSNRTVKSQLARLYLYKEDNEYFELVHSQDDYVLEQLKMQNPSLDKEFIYLNGFRGPIRIWEINYPENITFKEEYLKTTYPPELLNTR